MDEADLISYGLVGLISAVERFDPARRVKFETYAVTRIKGAIIDELRALDWVPRSVRARARAIEKKSAELESQPAPGAYRRGAGGGAGDGAGRVPGRPHPDLERVDRRPRRDVVGVPRRRAGLAHGHAGRRARRATRPTLLDVTDLRDTLADAIARLPERERIVVALYYYDNLSLKEIGEILGVTESRVSQLHTKAVLRLKGRLLEDAEEADSA